MSDVLRQTAQLIFGPQLGNELGTAFHSSSETRRLFIVGTVTLVATASVRIDHLLWADRVAALVGGGWPDAELLAACGLFAIGGGGGDRPLRCFHCDVAVVAVVPSASSELWTAHRAASPACYLARLGQLLAPGTPAAAGAAAESALLADSRRYQLVLRRLRQLLDSPVVAAASAYGFDPAYLRLCAARHFMRNDCRTVDKPGDLLRLAHDAESQLPGEARRIDLLRMLDSALPGIVGDAAVPPPVPLSPLPPSPAPTTAAAVVGVSADSPAFEAATAASGADADDRCVQCRTRTRNRVTLPCAHFLLCDRCLDSLNRCPRCNQLIAATVTAYIT